MLLEQLKNDIQNRLKHAPPLGHDVILDFGDDGRLYIGADNQVTETIPAEAETTLTLSSETMSAIVAGDTDPNMAVLTGKLKVSGKLGVALKLASYLEE